MKEGHNIEQKKFKLVLAAREPDLAIGSIYFPTTPDQIMMSDQHADPVTGQAYKIVGRSNESEWIECVKRMGGNIYEEQLDDPDIYYYEVETD